jgi:hypothetical protein
MRKLVFAAALACLALAGCNGSIAPPAPATALQGTAVDEQAMYAAEALYNVPAQAYTVADANGQLSPEVKRQAKAMLENAYKVLLIARSAYASGNAEGFNSQVRQLTILSDAIRQLIPK